MDVPDDALWKALEMKTRSPEKFTDVCELNGTDENGFLSNSMKINVMNTIVTEKIWINRVAGEFVFQPFIQTGQRDLVSAFASRHWLFLHDEPNLHLYFHQQGDTDGMRSPWNVLMCRRVLRR